MFSWLSGSEPAQPLTERRYNSTRFLLDAFFSLYDPEGEGEVDELCNAVDSSQKTLDDVATELCTRYEAKGAVMEDWIGETPRAMIKYRIDRFYLTYDPASLDKSADLVRHVHSGRYPLSVVLEKMCRKFSEHGAVTANWLEDYPLSMRKPPTETPVPTEYKEGDALAAVLEGVLYKGTVVETTEGDFTVKFTKGKA